MKSTTNKSMLPRGVVASSLLALAFITSSTALIRAQATFMPLGLFGGNHSRAHDVSLDGSVVVGTVVDAGQNAVSVFRWTREDSILRPSSMEHAAVSADGSAVVGAYPGPNGTEAFLWLADGTFQGIGDLPGGRFFSQAFDVSADGRFIVGGSSVNEQSGRSGIRAFRWSEPTGMVPIADPSPGTIARATSADGATVVGVTAGGGGFRWPVPPSKPLGLLGAFDVIPHAISGDGLTIVGETVFREGLSGFRSEAFRWTDLDGSVSLSPASIAYDVSADGSVIVGESPVHGAFYWTRDTGMVSLQNVLVSLGVTNLDGWTLTRAEGISPDGQTIVGAGGHDGHLEAWVATIPEPSTIVLAAFAAAGLIGWIVRRAMRLRAT